MRYEELLQARMRVWMVWRVRSGHEIFSGVVDNGSRTLAGLEDLGDNFRSRLQRGANYKSCFKIREEVRSFPRSRQYMVINSPLAEFVERQP